MNFTTIGNGGNSQVLGGALDLPNLTTINGSLTVDADGGTGATVTAGALSSVTSDLRVENEAVATVGASDGSLTVGDEVRVLNGSSLAVDAATDVSGVVSVDGGAAGLSDVTFNNTSAFTSDFTIAGNSTADFFNEATFDGDVTVTDNTFADSSPADGVDDNPTSLNFNDPGVDVEGLSQVNGAFTALRGVITLEDDSDPVDSGLHNLSLNSDVTIQGTGGGTPDSEVTDFVIGSDTDDVDAKLLFGGSTFSSLAINDADGLTLERLEVNNVGGVEIADASTGPLVIEDLNSGNNIGTLTLTDGEFETNGQLTADGITLIRSRTADTHGELDAGSAGIAYTENGGVDFPERIEYIGTRNISTGDELLPAGRPEAERQVEELVVAMDFTTDPMPVVTLGVDYEAINLVDVDGGSLSLGSATLTLGNNSTFRRGDGRLDPGPVPPEDALIFPEVDETGLAADEDGIDGISLIYDNTLEIDSTGLEFPRAGFVVGDGNDGSDGSNLILDLTVQGAKVNLRNVDGENTGYRINRNLTITDGSTLDFNGTDFEVNTVDNVQNTATFANTAELINSGDVGTLSFIGRGQMAVSYTGDTSTGVSAIFEFPNTVINKPDEDASDTEFRQVTFAVTSGDEDDGFRFTEDFTVEAAQDDGGSSAGAYFDPSVGQIFVDGNYVQQAAAVDADYSAADGEQFVVAGNFTKSESSASFVLGSGTARVDAFSVGSGSNTLSNNGGSAAVWVDNTFDVNGSISNAASFIVDADGSSTDGAASDAALTVTQDVNQSGSLSSVALPQGER